jgi:hypothetical protein
MIAVSNASWTRAVRVAFAGNAGARGEELLTTIPSGGSDPLVIERACG